MREPTSPLDRLPLLPLPAEPGATYSLRLASGRVLHALTPAEIEQTCAFLLASGVNPLPLITRDNTPDA